MFVRRRKVPFDSGTTVEYLQLVENRRVDGKHRQRVIGTLGRVDELDPETIDSLVEALARYGARVKVVRPEREGDIAEEWKKQWGPALVFERLWEQHGLGDVIRARAVERSFHFDVERCAFAMALQRIFAPWSDRFGSYWVKHVYARGFDELKLDHFYATASFFAEEKVAIESALFARNRDLFANELDLVLFDTTALYFEGKGPASLAKRGHSKDHRPQDTQVVVCVALSSQGWPIFSEVFPGNTNDVKVTEPVVDALVERFGIRRVILVCDRGMVSRRLLRWVRQRRFDYIAGMKMRRQREVQEEVLSRAGRYHEVDETLGVKEVRVGSRRYVVCRNPEEAERDRLAREAVLANLRERLSKGDRKGLLANRGFAKFLRVERSAFAIDDAAIAREARLDGKYVLRTSTDLPAAEVARAYKSLWQVEAVHRLSKDVLEARPIGHHKADRVRGHLFGSFLALYLLVALERALERQGVATADQARLLEDLKAVGASRTKIGDTTYLLRTQLPLRAAEVFKAVGVRVPPAVQPFPDA
jgi:hypothetical protein